MAGDLNRFGMSSSFPGAFFGSTSDGAGPAYMAGPIVPDEPEAMLMLDADTGGGPALLDLDTAVGAATPYNPPSVQLGFAPSMMGHHQPVTPQHRQPTVGFGAPAAAAGGAGAGAALPSTPAGAGTGGRVRPAQASLWFSHGHATARDKMPALADVAVQSMFCAVSLNQLGAARFPVHPALSPLCRFSFSTRK